MPASGEITLKLKIILKNIQQIPASSLFFFPFFSFCANAVNYKFEL